MSKVYEILHTAPHKPGVYLMKNAKGKVFYVGKAKDLHNRMHQYINPSSDTRHFVQILDDILYSVEFFITESEKEALLLENTLIKKHYPKHNVLIKDDKNYFSIRLKIKEPFPRLEVVRKRKKRDNALYFGPYSSATMARKMIKLVNKHFMLRDCSDKSFKKMTRPCVRHQMGRCHGPCCLPVEVETYRKEIERVKLFLEGKKELLIEQLTPLMQEASAELNFELAAKIRDQIAAVSGSLEKQVADLSRNVNWDVIGFHRENELATFAVVRIRDGVIRGRNAFDVSCRAISDITVVDGFVKQYYEDAWPLPKKVILPLLPDGWQTLAEWISDRAGHKVEISVAERGAPNRLAKIARANAEQQFFERLSKHADTMKTLEILRRKLSLRNLPKRIECIDISNIQGTLAVGSVICFTDGLADKNNYRKYKIKTLSSPDDFAMMKEVLTRRFKRGLEEDNLPDLLVVDGGKGQLAQATTILDELGINNVDVVSLAKSRLKDGVGEGQIAEQFEGKMRTPERVFLPKVKNPVILKPGTSELGLLMQVRDEAHRFAITYHRQLRSKKNLRSGLLDIPGIGTKRAKQLLTHFGSLKKVREAKAVDIAALTGFNENLAEEILRHLS